MVKKLLLGIALVVGLLAVAGTTLIALRGDATGRARTESDKAALRRSLEAKFGGQAQVEFVCQFPIVGAAPCLADSAMDSREVKLTWTALPPAGDAAPDEQAWAMARMARDTSSFAGEADKTEVIFQDGHVVRTYSFTPEDLAAEEPQVPDPAGQPE